jgi:hypothetical protein
MVCGVSFAKRDLPKVRLILKDNTKIEGFLRSDLSDRDTAVAISPEQSGKKQKFSTKTIEKLEILPSTDSDKVTEVYPVYVFSSMHSGKGRISDYPMMLILTYKGKNANGYIGRMWVYNSVVWNLEPIAYYKLSKSDVARPYLNFGTVFKKSRNTMKNSFEEYPELVQELEDGTLSRDDINKDPMLMVKELDKILDKNNNH